MTTTEADLDKLDRELAERLGIAKDGLVYDSVKGDFVMYAETISHRWGRDFSVVHRASDKSFYAPLHWKKPRMIFTCSMSDFFHKQAEKWVDEAVAIMALCPQHTFQVLSKRPGRMAHYFNDPATPYRVASQFALLYNSMYEQRGNDTNSSQLRRVGNRPRGAHLAIDETRRQPEKEQFRREAMPKSASGIPAASRVSFDSDNNQGSPYSNRGTQISMGVFQREDSARPHDQSQERNQTRQCSSESGISDLFSAEETRPGCSSRQSQLSERIIASKDTSYGRGRVGDQAASSFGHDGQDNRSTVCNDAKGNICYLPANHLAPHLIWPLGNVWLGTSVESQKYAPRIDVLARVPAPVRFVSAEPLLGPLALARSLYTCSGCGATPCVCKGLAVHWVICGAESGPGARPMSLDWARSLRDQCNSAGVPFFLKQVMVGAKKVGTPLLDGRQWVEMPGMAREEEANGH